MGFLSILTDPAARRYTRGVRDLRIWKLHDLIDALGPSIREGNDDAKSYITEENGDRLATFYLGPETPPPPPIDGVDRWLIWDCYQFEASSGAYRRFMWQCMHEFFANTQHPAAAAVAASAKALSAMRHELCCKARTRLSVGGATDEWILIRSCPKHSSLQYST